MELQVEMTLSPVSSWSEQSFRGETTTASKAYPLEEDLPWNEDQLRKHLDDIDRSIDMELIGAAVKNEWYYEVVAIACSRYSTVQ